MLIKELQDKYGKQNMEVISIRDNHLLIPLVASKNGLLQVFKIW
jgi:hypothetical protein